VAENFTAVIKAEWVDLFCLHKKSDEEDTLLEVLLSQKAV
jgi:hypothetical protein